MPVVDVPPKTEGFANRRATRGHHTRPEPVGPATNVGRDPTFAR